MNKTTLRNLHKLCLFTCSLQNVITTFFVRHECGQVQGLGRPKLSTRKRIVYQFCSKIYDYMNKWALQIFSRMAGLKSAQDLHHLAWRTVQRWRLGVAVLELTESIEIMNAKSLNYWQEVANKLKISRVDDTPYGHFTVLSGCFLKRFLVILTDYERFHSLYLFSSIFQGVTFYKCNVKVVINCSNRNHIWISIL